MGRDPRGSTSSPGRESKLSKLGTLRAAWKGSGLLSVCLSGPLSPAPASSHSLLQCPPPSSLGQGCRGEMQMAMAFSSPRKLLQRSRKRLELRWGEERGNAGRVPGC